MTIFSNETKSNNDEAVSTTHPSELLSAYLDNEVTMEERARVEAWLDSSEEARFELDDLRRVADLLRETLPALEAPSSLLDRVRRNITENGRAEEPVAPAPPAVTVTPVRTSPERLGSGAGAGWASAAGILASLAAVVVTAILVVPPEGARPPQPPAPEFAFAKKQQPSLQAAADPAEKARREAIPFEMAEAAGGGGEGEPASPTPPQDSKSEAQGGLELALLDGLAAAEGRDYVELDEALADGVEPGDVLPLIERDGTRVAVVRVTVVDVRKALGQVEMLLQRHDVNRYGDSLVAERLDDDATNAESRPETDGEAEAGDDEAAEPEAYAVYVSASPVQLAATLRDLRSNEEVVDVRGPGDVPVLAQLDNETALGARRMRVADGGSVPNLVTDAAKPTVKPDSPADPAPLAIGAARPAATALPTVAHPSGEKRGVTMKKRDNSYQVLGRIPSNRRADRRRAEPESASRAKEADRRDPKRVAAEAEERVAEQQDRQRKLAAEGESHAPVRVLLVLERRPER